jgi:hypothetical protein
MHRIVNNTPEGMYTDHINMDKLDNRKSNLRTCNKSQNSMNRKKQRATRHTSKYKGVCWCKTKQKWKARIKFKSREYSLGYHTNEESAAEAYNERAKELFGEFAYFNNIEEGRK